ncbi:Undecaprenyl diphosphate synthase [hydrothermal vent metagenome]|uniref:Undecaprenyl diphosphate synthase n=1 Tax=hydrothermal vent metagenome TaxID=652676 RepID=A0A3B0TSV5_9ZZZZ
MHVGIIMDGNGRWATRRGLARLIGHKRGAAQVKKIVKNCPKLGVNTLTLYAFSTENWKRAAHEVEGLMKLFRGYLANNLVELHEKNVRVRFLGDPTPLSPEILVLMERLRSLTEHNTGLQLNVAINYGGRDEMVRATKAIAVKVAAGEMAIEDITEERFSEFLDTHDQNDPDLIIRTAGEMRLSNFLTWQSAYSEFAFLQESWPEFTPDVFENTLENFHSRTRKFGAVVVSRSEPAE